MVLLGTFFRIFYWLPNFFLVLINKFCFRASSLSPNARMARISSLENMLGISSNSLVAMASQLSEAEERERAFTNRGRWNQLRSMGEAKNLLQYMFNSLAETRCLRIPNATPPVFKKTFFSIRVNNQDFHTFSLLMPIQVPIMGERCRNKRNERSIQRNCWPSEAE